MDCVLKLNELGWSPDTQLLLWFPSFETRRKKTWLCCMLTTKAQIDQPAHPRSLVSAFVIRNFESVLAKFVTRKTQYFSQVSVDEQACVSLTGGSDTEETFSRDYVRSGPAIRKGLAALMPYEKAMMSFPPNFVASHLCLGFLLSDWFNVIY